MGHSHSMDTHIRVSYLCLISSHCTQEYRGNPNRRLKTPLYLLTAQVSVQHLHAYHSVKQALQDKNVSTDTMSQHSSVPREEKMNKKTSGTTRALQGEDFSQRDQLHSTTTLSSCSTFSSTNKLLDQPFNAQPCTVEGRYPGLARRGFNWQPSCYLPHAQESSFQQSLQLSTPTTIPQEISQESTSLGRKQLFVARMNSSLRQPGGEGQHRLAAADLILFPEKPLRQA